MPIGLVPFCQVAAAPPTSQDIHLLVSELEVLLEKARAVNGSDLNSDDSDQESGDTSHDVGRRENIIASLKSYINCLMDLLPSMDRVANHASQLEIDERTSVPDGFQVSGPAQAYVVAVRDRFANADSRLVERLGEANWQRHTALRMALEQGIEEPKSIFVPVSIFHDSGLGGSVPTNSYHAITVASHSSFVSSLAEGTTGGLRVPSTPKEVYQGKAFTCEICGHKLSKIKNRIDWK